MATETIKELEHLSNEERLREMRLFIQPGERKSQGDLSYVCTYLRGRRGVRLFPAVPNGERTQTETLETLFYCEGDCTLAQVAQRSCGLPSLEIFKPDWAWL